METPSVPQLRAFVAICDFGSFSAAADELGTSQPGISQQVKALEEIVGYQLLERGRSGASPTPEGERILSASRSVLEELDKWQEAVVNLSSNLTRLRIAAIPTMAPYLLPALIGWLRNHRPDVELEIRELQTDHLLAQLQAGHIDLGLLALPVGSEGISQLALGDDDFLVALPTTHPLAKRKSIALTDLAAEEVLLLEEGHCLRGQALEVCTLAGLGKFQNVRAAGLSTVCQMVAAGQGVTLIPASAVPLETHPTRGVVAVPIQGSNPPHRSIGLVWRTNSSFADQISGLSQELSNSEPFGKTTAQRSPRKR